MILATPPGATILRPPGIDSNLLEIRGPGYRIGLDDYGRFSGQATTRVGGRRARVERQQRGACRVTIYEVELPTRSRTDLRCERDGKHCAAPPGRAQIVGDCLTPAACSTVQNIVSTIGFASPAPTPTAKHSTELPSDICQPDYDRR